MCVQFDEPLGAQHVFPLNTHVLATMFRMNQCSCRKNFVFSLLLVLYNYYSNYYCYNALNLLLANYQDSCIYVKYALISKLAIAHSFGCHAFAIQFWLHRYSLTWPFAHLALAHFLRLIPSASFSDCLLCKFARVCGTWNVGSNIV